MNKHPTNLTDNQWQIIEKFFDYKRKRKYELRSIWNAISYVIKTGSQWRMLPKGFAPWQTVYYYFRNWKCAGIVEVIMEEVVYKIRESFNKSSAPTACVVDSQSAKKTALGGFEIGYDAGKKIRGRKRHIVTDTLGNLLAVEVHSASYADRAKGFDVISLAKEKYKQLKRYLLMEDIREH